VRLKFVSNGKTVEMDAKGKLDASVISVSGLGAVQKKYNTIRYVDIPGQVTLSESVLPREISVKGDLFIKGAMPVAKYHIFFSAGGTMHIFNTSGRKKIDYKVMGFKTGDKNGDYVPFELSLICDMPYFCDSVNSPINIYRRVDKITGAFSLPAVFTERITSVDVSNLGQTVSEPVIEIKCSQEGVYSGGICILNETTGKKLVLDTKLSLGEVIKIDVKNRKITSNARENCYGVLNSECILSEFLIEKGLNHISVTDENDGETVESTIYFDNLYVEAM